MRIFLSRIATVALCAAVAIGCSTGTDEVAGGELSGAGPPPLEVKHDIAGLAQAFPGIGAPESVAWVQWSGPAGEGANTEGADTEGANTMVRWTDAVVRLTPVVVDAMVTQFKPTDTGRKPVVQDVLQSEVSAGPFLTGELLDAGFSSDSTSTYAFLDRERATLVLQATSLD